jgi:hypothetical protein
VSNVRENGGLAGRIVKDATLKVYPGAPHGRAQTTAYKDTFSTPGMRRRDNLGGRD